MGSGHIRDNAERLLMVKDPVKNLTIALLNNCCDRILTPIKRSTAT